VTLAGANKGGFIRSLELERDRVADFDSHPFSIPAIRTLTTLEFDARATFFVGENGSGKSTLVEAFAIAAGLNPEGGSQNFAFDTRASHSELHEYIRLVRGIERPATAYFLRAESFYNVATQVEDLDRSPSFGPKLVDSYGGRSLHEQSHGESFLSLVVDRFGPRGLYVLDEPEAALSVPGCLALLRRMHELAAQGSQFVVATHSPILLASPGALIYSITEEGFEPTAYENTEPYTLTRSFLEDRQRFFRHLLFDEPGQSS